MAEHNGGSRWQSEGEVHRVPGDRAVHHEQRLTKRRAAAVGGEEDGLAAPHPPNGRGRRRRAAVKWKRSAAPRRRLMPPAGERDPSWRPPAAPERRPDVVHLARRRVPIDLGHPARAPRRASVEARDGGVQDRDPAAARGSRNAEAAHERHLTRGAASATAPNIAATSTNAAGRLVASATNPITAGPSSRPV
jgi:hypothetical protein